MTAAITRGTRSLIAAVTAAVLTVASPGLQGSQAFAGMAKGAPVRIAQAGASALRTGTPVSAVNLAPAAALTGLRPVSAPAAPSARPAGVSQDLGRTAKDLQNPLADITDSSKSDDSAAGAGEEAQRILQGGRGTGARAAVFAAADAVTSAPLGRFAGSASGVKSAVPAAKSLAADAAKPSFIRRAITALRRSGMAAASLALVAALSAVTPSLGADRFDRQSWEQAVMNNPWSRFKLGGYATSDKTNYLPLWWYLGFDVLRQELTPERRHPLKLEVGYTVETVSKPDTFLGRPSYDRYWKRAFFVGGAMHINTVLDVSAGMKYRDEPSGYLGLSFKWGEPAEMQKRIKRFKREHPSEYERLENRYYRY